jgi:hypothetical protein
MKSVDNAKCAPGHILGQRAKVRILRNTMPKLNGTRIIPAAKAKCHFLRIKSALVERAIVIQETLWLEQVLLWVQLLISEHSPVQD